MKPQIPSILVPSPRFKVNFRQGKQCLWQIYTELALTENRKSQKSDFEGKNSFNRRFLWLYLIKSCISTRFNFFHHKERLGKDLFCHVFWFYFPLFSFKIVLLFGPTSGRSVILQTNCLCVLRADATPEWISCFLRILPRRINLFSHLFD